MFDRFSASARRIVVQAQEEARKRYSSGAGLEYLLLAFLCEEQQSLVASILAGFDLTYKRADEIMPLNPPPYDPYYASFPPETKAALELTLRAALGLGDSTIEPEHILIGLCRQLQRDSGHRLHAFFDPEAVLKAISLVRPPYTNPCGEQPLEYDDTKTIKVDLPSALVQAASDRLDKIYSVFPRPTYDPLIELIAALQPTSPAALPFQLCTRAYRRQAEIDRVFPKEAGAEDPIANILAQISQAIAQASSPDVATG